MYSLFKVKQSTQCRRLQSVVYNIANKTRTVVNLYRFRNQHESLLIDNNAEIREKKGLQLSTNTKTNKILYM